jgi:hypothetical protein
LALRIRAGIEHRGLREKQQIGRGKGSPSRTRCRLPTPPLACPNRQKNANVAIAVRSAMR